MSASGNNYASIVHSSSEKARVLRGADREQRDHDDLRR
jgi:hypothetical protein